MNHLDDTGTIAVGNLADLAVLDRDPFAGASEEICQTRVEQTFVGGRRVYAAPDLTPRPRGPYPRSRSDNGHVNAIDNDVTGP